MNKHKFLNIILFVFAFVNIAILSCSFSDMKRSHESKIDFALRQKLDESKDEYLQVLGKYKGVSGDEIRLTLTNLGGNVGTTTNSIFTLGCSKETLKEIIKLDEVISLELSKNVNLKNKQPE